MSVSLHENSNSNKILEVKFMFVVTKGLDPLPFTI